MSARRVEVAEAGTLPGAGYASAFEIARRATDTRSPEQWARAAWEGAPRPVRWFLVVAWKAGLGLRLGPRPSPDHVLGWAKVSATPEVVVLESRSMFMSARNVVRIDASRVVWTTLVRFEKGPARALWSLAAPVHHRMIAYLLERASAE
jgi:hypothetical protein